MAIFFSVFWTDNFFSSAIICFSIDALSLLLADIFPDFNSSITVYRESTKLIRSFSLFCRSCVILVRFCWRTSRSSTFGVRGALASKVCIKSLFWVKNSLVLSSLFSNDNITNFSFNTVADLVRSSLWTIAYSFCFWSISSCSATCCCFKAISSSWAATNFENKSSWSSGVRSVSLIAASSSFLFTRSKSIASLFSSWSKMALLISVISSSSLISTRIISSWSFSIASETSGLLYPKSDKIALSSLDKLFSTGVFLIRVGFIFRDAIALINNILSSSDANSWFEK